MFCKRAVPHWKNLFNQGERLLYRNFLVLVKQLLLEEFLVIQLLLYEFLVIQLLLKKFLVTQLLLEEFLVIQLLLYFQEVEPMGKESDHIQIIALTAALGVPVRVEYMDRGEGDQCNHHHFPEDSNPVVTLLYRPGHYDILYTWHTQHLVHLTHYDILYTWHTITSCTPDTLWHIVHLTQHYILYTWHNMTSCTPDITWNLVHLT